MIKLHTSKVFIKMLPVLQMDAAVINFTCAGQAEHLKRVEMAHSCFLIPLVCVVGGGAPCTPDNSMRCHTHTHLVVAVHLRLAARLETWLDSSLLCLSTPHMLWTRGENTLQGSGAQEPTRNLQLPLGSNLLPSRFLWYSFSDWTSALHMWATGIFTIAGSTTSYFPVFWCEENHWAKTIKQADAHGRRPRLSTDVIIFLPYNWTESRQPFWTGLRITGSI